MSGPRLLFVAVGAGVIAAVAWWQWPRAAPTTTTTASARDAGVVAPRPAIVRTPDNEPWTPQQGVAIDVRDERGGAVAGATLRANVGSRVIAEDVTDDAGRAVLGLGSGGYDLVVADHVIGGATALQLGGVPSAPIPLVAELGEPAVALPEPSVGSSGLVGVVTAGGARLQDLTVTPVFLGGVGPGHPVVNDRIPQPIELAPRRFVATAGGFRWERVTPGTYLLRISSPGYGTREVRVNAIADGFGDGSIALAPAASLSGMVSDGRAVPIANVVVRASVDGAIVAQSRSTSEGIYLLEDLPAGPVVVSLATSKGECTADDQTITVAAGARTTQRLEMLCAWQGH